MCIEYVCPWEQGLTGTEPREGTFKDIRTRLGTRDTDVTTPHPTRDRTPATDVSRARPRPGPTPARTAPAGRITRG